MCVLCDGHTFVIYMDNKKKWILTLLDQVKVDFFFFFTKLSGRLLQESGIFLGIVKKKNIYVIKIGDGFVFDCLIWFFMYHQQSFSYVGMVFLGWASTKLGLMCLAQGHNAVTPVRL